MGGFQWRGKHTAADLSSFSGEYCNSSIYNTVIRFLHWSWGNCCLYNIITSNICGTQPIVWSVIIDLLPTLLLMFSQDKRNFLREPPAGIRFPFDFQQMSPVAMVMLEEDELLSKMRFHLVPKQWVKVKPLSKSIDSRLWDKIKNTCLCTV